MMKFSMFAAILASLLLCDCSKSAALHSPDLIDSNITAEPVIPLSLHSDKAMYQPGDTAWFTIDKIPGSSARIRYRHLNDIVAESAIASNKWYWVVPAADYKGYLVEVYTPLNGRDTLHGSIAVDVSSDWTRFPRYGFLSNYGQLTDKQIAAVLENLSRHHINGLQYYDWQYKHHWPLGGTAAAPMASWKEISNKDVYLSTLKKYIQGGHDRNMRSMFYNLAFGALHDAAADGVAEEWYLFKDRQHTEKDKHPLPQPFFKSDIYVVDAGNRRWREYLAAKNEEVYNALNFDGYHVDALGDRGELYDYDGNTIDQQASFKPFLESMKSAAPSKRLVMNAVNQWGQQQSIASSPVDFLYTEVWSPNDRYNDLANIILNNSYWGQAKKTVLAAYMNYNYSDNAGYFNTPGILYTDAVIFAFGGAHLELGEHMLSKEYFPHNKLQVSEELKGSLTAYYDFSVAYENLLRDGGQWQQLPLLCTDGKMTLNNWSPASGEVSSLCKRFDTRLVFHLINFTNARSMDWRDNTATQAAATPIQSAVLQFKSPRAVKEIWVASPDANHCAPVSLPFTQTGENVQFTLPSLTYWSMIVADF